MNRRSVIGAGGAIAFAGLSRPAGATFSKRTISAAPTFQESSAFIPIEVRTHANAPISAIHIRKFWPDETPSDNRLKTWSVDLSLPDSGGITRVIMAWHLSRSAHQCMTGNPVKMQFPLGARAHVAVSSVRGLGEKSASNQSAWSEQVPGGSLVVLASARSSSGRPPQLMDLRYFPSERDLRLADGSPRDFDALLIETT